MRLDHFAKASLLAATVALAACAPAPNDDKLQELETQTERIAGQQQLILTQLNGVAKRLEDLGKGQKDILAKAAAPARKAGRPAEDPNKVHVIPVGDSASKGPDDAKVTLIEFSDFQCPYCERSTALVDQLLEAYPNDLRFVYKNYPLAFHKQALPAAKAAIAAGKQDKFWEMHDIIFENYRTLTDASYAGFAEEIGINVEQFNKDFASKEVQAAVDAEKRQAAAAGVRGTPTFFINGKKPQSRSLDSYKAIIDAELKKKAS